MLKSKQTGFIHYNYHAKDGCHDTIPAFENACHILDLLRTKQAENLYEAKFLLEKLLAFQTPSGNFPQYIHEYPMCYDGLAAFYLLAPFFHIHREFHHILPNTLENAIRRMQDYCQTVPYASPHQIALLKASLGEPLGALQAESASVWSDLLVARSMTNQDLPLDDLEKKWHFPSNTFIGLSELQDGKKPGKTLLDVFMGCDLGNHPVMLRKALVKPLNLTPKTASSLIYCKTHKPCPPAKNFHLMSWDGLVCQNSQHYLQCLQELQMDFTYSGEMPEKCEKQIELKFFYPHDGQIQPATTFRLKDPVKMGPFTLTFTLLEGQGEFYGHISRGNRPAQIRTDASYDWQIGLRTVRRDSNVKLRVNIQRADLSI